MGLGSIAPLTGVSSPAKPTAWFGKMAEISKGKDTTTGHWEMVGCPLYQPLPLYPQGFPDDVVNNLYRRYRASILATRRLPVRR